MRFWLFFFWGTGAAFGACFKWGIARAAFFLDGGKRFGLYPIVRSIQNTTSLSGTHVCGATLYSGLFGHINHYKLSKDYGEISDLRSKRVPG